MLKLEPILGDLADCLGFGVDCFQLLLFVKSDRRYYYSFFFPISLSEYGGHSILNLFMWFFSFMWLWCYKKFGIENL